MTNLGALASNATIPDAGLSSPVGGVFRLLWQGSGQLSTSAANGVNYVFSQNAADVAGSFNVGTAAGARYNYGFYYTAAQQVVAGLTTKLVITATVETQNTAPGQTITVVLKPGTITTSNLVVTGTTVTGSTVTCTTPGANAFVPFTSGDFTEPADGFYVPIITIPTTLSAGVSMVARCWAHNV